MGRKPNPDRRFEVLEAVTAHVRARGLHQTALRALADELGTSTYTFVYHFGSKDGMIGAVLERVNMEREAALEQLSVELTGTIAQRLRALWDWSLREEQLAATALMLDALSLARVEPSLYLPAAQRYVASTEGFIASQLAAAGGSAHCASATTSVLMGLHANYLTDGDRTAADARFERVVTAFPVSAAA